MTMDVDDKILDACLRNYLRDNFKNLSEKDLDEAMLDSSVIKKKMLGALDVLIGEPFNSQTVSVASKIIAKEMRSFATYFERIGKDEYETISKSDG